MRAPHTDEYSVGVDREVGRRLAVAARLHPQGWRRFHRLDGRRRSVPRTHADAARRHARIPVFELVNCTADRRFLLTNPDGYSMTYNGLVMAVEKRRSHGWQAFGSYTFSRAFGLQASSGTTAAGAQSQHAWRLPNAAVRTRSQRSHQRARPAAKRSAAHVPRDGQRSTCRGPASWSPPICRYFSGKPWASTDAGRAAAGRPAHPARAARLAPAVVAVAARSARVEDDPLRRRGTHRAALDVLNALNDTAEEGLASDNLFSPNFGQPTSFMDPRRAMVGVRLNLGR